MTSSRKQHVASGSLFLAGGGVSALSARVDAAFVAACPPDLPIIYIPNAMPAQPPDQSLQWFTSLMAPHGAKRIEMWDHLEPRLAPEDVAGVYMSGGDTCHLLDELRRTGFDAYLRSVLDAGKSIYGQSAGAILLGECLATSRAAAMSGRADEPGLGLAPGHAVACHYRPEDDERLSMISRAKGLTVVAISDDAGAAFADGRVSRVGDLPVSLFHKDGSLSRI